MNQVVQSLPFEIQNVICTKVHKLNFKSVKKQIENYEFCLKKTYIKYQEIPYSEWSFCFWKDAYRQRNPVHIKVKDPRANKIICGYYEIVPIYFRNSYARIAYVKHTVVNYSQVGDS